MTPPCATASHWTLCAVLALTLPGCATLDAPQSAASLPTVSSWLPAHLVLLGEQHDNPLHQQLQAQAVRELSRQKRLAAVVLEMAEQGRTTQSLPPDATETQVQTALRWSDAAWPWSAYGPVVMAAVRSGVPVLGANLPHANMATQMRNPQLDHLLPETAWLQQQTAIREGHCHLLPETQVLPMTRIQVARDQTMARVAQAAIPFPQTPRPEQTVLLIAGQGHVRPDLGIPWFLPPHLRVKVVQLPPGNTPTQDPCTDLRERFKPGTKTP